MRPLLAILALLTWLPSSAAAVPVAFSGSLRLVLGFAADPSLVFDRDRFWNRIGGGHVRRRVDRLARDPARRLRRRDRTHACRRHHHHLRRRAGDERRRHVHRPHVRRRRHDARGRRLRGRDPRRPDRLRQSVPLLPGRDRRGGRRSSSYLRAGFLRPCSRRRRGASGRSPRVRRRSPDRRRPIASSS